MSSKTIAVDARVYDKLASVKREGESFSKAIDRLIDEAGDARTGRDILRGLTEIPRLSAEDAERILVILAEDRTIERWDTLADPPES